MWDLDDLAAVEVAQRPGGGVDGFWPRLTGEGGCLLRDPLADVALVPSAGCGFAGWWSAWEPNAAHAPELTASLEPAVGAG